jgi:nicotinamidase-related amidase
MKIHNNLLRPENSLLLIIDVQEKLIPVITGHEEISKNISRLIRGCKVFNIPIVYTQQYTKGLGNTIDIVRKELEGIEHIEKLEISCFQNEDFITRIKEFDNIQNLVVCGIEGHVCVNQTCHDALEYGYNTHIVADAVSSRKSYDYKYALDKMKMSGILPTTVEMALFELAHKSKTQQFKEVSKIAKEFTDKDKKIGFQM